MCKQVTKFFRYCPQCKEKVYHTRGYNCKTAIRKKKVCNNCRGEKRSLSIMGANNPFYGKHHTKKMKMEASLREKGKKQTGKRLLKSQKSAKMGRKVINGRSPYQIWVEKYGKKEADKKERILNAKRSIFNSGKGNPMYGKPSPKGSGNGWKCWYKGIFFRSLRELSFFINFIEKNNLQWESGEQNKFKIRYIDPLGNERNYFPDYVVGNVIYECKPKRLWESPLIICKTKAAIKFGRKNGFKYKLVDYKINHEQIKCLYKRGLIKFDKRYKKKFLNF